MAFGDFQPFHLSGLECPRDQWRGIAEGRALERAEGFCLSGFWAVLVLVGVSHGFLVVFKRFSKCLVCF